LENVIEAHAWPQWGLYVPPAGKILTNNLCFNIQEIVQDRPFTEVLVGNGFYVYAGARKAEDLERLEWQWK